MLFRSNLFAFVSLAAALPATTVTTAQDYGYWDVNITSSSSASGYREGDVYAEYSGNPGKISHIAWLYSPEFRNTTVTSDDPTFEASPVDYSGNRSVTIHQTVKIDGVDTKLEGTGSVMEKCGLGGAGRGCAGSTRVTAVLSTEP